MGRGGAVVGEGRNLRTHTPARAVNESLLIDWEKLLPLCELKCPKCMAMHRLVFTTHLHTVNYRL